MGVTEPEPTATQTSRPERSSGLVLLPSHLFFVRRVVLPPGLSAEELTSFVEVSLEQSSPFALPQLYYGYYRPPESEELLVYAAYRKQLAVYEDDDWAEAELVLPDFAPVLALKPDGPTLVLLKDSYEVTALLWSGGRGVPERILSRKVELDEAGESNQETVSRNLLQKMAPLPDNVTTLVLERSGEGGIRDKNLVFSLRARDGAAMTTEIARPGFLSMDVRDKGFLQATRKALRQNRLLWAGVLAIFAAFIALGVFEAALFASRQIMESRERRILALEPEVRRIMEEEQLANRLEELSGERLLPFEMIDYLNQTRPRSIYFTRVSTDGLRSFELEALTPRSQDVDRYQQILEQASELQGVEIRGLRTRPDGRTSFSIVGTFKEGFLASRLAVRTSNRGQGSLPQANEIIPDTVPQAPDADESAESAEEGTLRSEAEATAEERDI
jgi:hypothetical protein